MPLTYLEDRKKVEAAAHLHPLVVFETPQLYFKIERGAIGLLLGGWTREKINGKMVEGFPVLLTGGRRVLLNDAFFTVVE